MARCCCGGKGGSGTVFNGALICTSGCTTKPDTGKAFEFYAAPEAKSQLIIKPGFDIAITAGIDSIEISKWSQTPNTGFTGRIYVTRIPSTGGTIALDFITSANRWITIQARNPAKSNAFDTCCWELEGNIAVPVGYS